MKGKEVAIIAPSSPVSANSDGKSDSSTLPAARFASRNASSKYDFVKVKVWLGGNADHYYVLSRFLLSRMLTVTKIPNHVAIKIAQKAAYRQQPFRCLFLSSSQLDLEANFKLMERRGYGEEYINRYKMMTRFHHQRVPLVILVCGTVCSGKSTIATQLAQRLNLPNVLQTDMVYELLRTSTDAPLASTPVWARDFGSPEEFITEFCQECRIVRKGLAGDLKKAMKDGKPIIIEGIHLNPSIYLMDDENRQITSTSIKKEEPASESTNSDNNPTACDEQLLGSNEAEQIVLTTELTEVTIYLETVIMAEPSKSEGRTLKDGDQKTSENKEKTGAEPIIIPIVLKMAEFDHKALLEEWISTRSCGIVQDEDKAIKNLKIIQDYLCSFEPQGLSVVNISATTFPQTLDWLHGYLLQCIERGIAAGTDK